jgi:hypothetical protein
MWYFRELGNEPTQYTRDLVVRTALPIEANARALRLNLD